MSVLIYGVSSPADPEKVTVTFDTNGGTPAEIEAKTLDVGGTVEAPANPEKNGYDFAGWKNGDALFDFSTPITTNITLKAEWTLHNYTITYKNVTEHENPVTYTIEDEIILKAPTKGTEPAQTIFVQWHSEETLQKPIEKIAKGTTGDKTFYAEWSDKAVYTVTFNTDGGSEVAVQRVKDGEKATKPATDPEKEGYTFKGWDFDFTTPITENKTVNANWEIKKYTVKFMNGETEVKKTEVEYNSTIPDNEMPDTATLSSSGGESFAGWFNGANRFDSTTHIKTDTTLNATFGIPVTKNADGSYSFADGTYKAVWEGDNAIIRFKLPEEMECKAKDSLLLTGTINFGEQELNQMYIQTADEQSIALFGYGMIASWINGDLVNEKNIRTSFDILTQTNNKEGAFDGLKVSDCKFAAVLKEDVEKPENISISVKDLKLYYIKYNPATIFADGTITNGGYGTAEFTFDEDLSKVAHVVAGSWMKAIYTLPEKIDITGKKIKITAKVSEKYVQGTGLFKLIFVTDDTHQSEITSNENGNIDWCNPLTTEYKEYIGSDLWKAHEIDNSADLTNITSIIINPQSGAGDIWIKNIEFVD